MAQSLRLAFRKNTSAAVMGPRGLWVRRIQGCLRIHVLRIHHGFHPSWCARRSLAQRAAWDSHAARIGAKPIGLELCFQQGGNFRGARHQENLRRNDPSRLCPHRHRAQGPRFNLNRQPGAWRRLTRSRWPEIARCLSSRIQRLAAVQQTTSWAHFRVNAPSSPACRPPKPHGAVQGTPTKLRSGSVEGASVTNANQSRLRRNFPGGRCPGPSAPAPVRQSVSCARNPRSPPASCEDCPRRFR